MNRRRPGLQLLPSSLALSLLVACAHGQPPPEGAEAVAPVEEDLSAFDEDAPPEETPDAEGAAGEAATGATPASDPPADAAPGEQAEGAGDGAPPEDAAAPEALAMVASKKK